MAMKLAFFILLTISTSAFFSSALPNDINWWCDKTPNPEPCKHFMSGKQQKYGLIMGKSGFRKVAVELAMERALTAESHTKWLGQKCRNEKEKAAWADCVTLYEDTISQLNQTLDPTTKCTDFDAQTWLSAALTNLETCHAGFMELNASDYMLPLMYNNVTKLISNTLAINNGSSSPVESYKHGFPTWFKPGDRKLLQSAAPRPNIVVAKDGSGNYRTIKAAIDAAAKRSGSGRFVIRIKRGVYFENIEIDKKMKNIMLVGDGVKYTIISGSRSVGGGSTTFKSGTVKSYKHGFPTWFKPGDRKLLQTAAPRPNIVVAKDGSGNYRTIKAAIDAAAKRSGSGRFVIRIKRGVYFENIEIDKKMKNIMLVGDGVKYTIISGSRSVGGGSTTFKSGTVIVTGSGFIARGITFRNTAGPQNHQAVALRSSSDLSVFYRCGFEGYQDTLYTHSQRQFYKECYIYGTVDFIFGNAAVVLQNCMIYGRRGMKGQQVTITAQGRTDSNQNTGISIQNSRIMAASDLKPVLSSFKTYLGRPWKQYSRTVFLENYIDSLVDPAGWLEWDGNFALNTLYYGEYRNFGPGSSTSRRVKWRGYRVITNPNEASRFSVANFLAGRSWLPGTGVPFHSGL
ncbi:pectinesterase 2-like protein [Tanacetum coccineum]